MLPNVLAVDASHNSSVFFERPPFDYPDSSFEQKIGQVCAQNGRTLEFEVVGDRSNFIGFTKHRSPNQMQDSQT